MTSDSLCLPNIVQQFHYVLVQYKDYGNVCTDSSEPWCCSLVESAVGDRRVGIAILITILDNND